MLALSLWTSDSDGPCLGRPARRCSAQRPHQPGRDRQDVPARPGAAGRGRDRQDERARARPAGAGHGLLRHCPGALHGLRHPRGAALPVGGRALALGCRGGQDRGQERHFAGPRAPGRGPAAPVVRAGGAARGDARHQGRLVPAGGPGQPGRVLPLDVADTEDNRAAFERPGACRGESAFPQVRFVALVENGTHVLFSTRLGGFAEGETTLAHEALPALRPGMLCLADRQFFGHALWQEAAATGADLLWRVKRNLRLAREARLADGSYLTTVYPSEKDRRHRTGGNRVRVVEYRLEGVAGGAAPYRLGATSPGPAPAPPAGPAAFDHEGLGG